MRCLEIIMRNSRDASLAMFHKMSHTLRHLGKYCPGCADAPISRLTWALALEQIVHSLVESDVYAHVTGLPAHARSWKPHDGAEACGPPAACVG